MLENTTIINATKSFNVRILIFLPIVVNNPMTAIPTKAKIPVLEPLISIPTKLIIIKKYSKLTLKLRIFIFPRDSRVIILDKINGSINNII
ncbi:hypothetical protein D3C73_1451590 [compost metagenome]